ncbi:hypothetical protein PENSPDRAFT_604818 [Peniophora sp. CONT]|nr:hypothetical protein PENSPDRAFT_604818 [Peniophora sp. CONT]
MLTALLPVVGLAAAPVAYAATAFTFSPPQQSPLEATANYTGASNGTLATQPVVPGAVFDRFIQVWLENQDFDTVSSTATFQKLAAQGILLDSYYALTHPSEPNYLAAAGGDFFGLGNDDLINVPSNVSTIVDLLEAKNISWASYQENMPTVGYEGFNFASENYLNGSATEYDFYFRKHNPTIMYDSVVNDSSRLARHRNFNDFAADVNASALPQWIFITPNMVNDGHDTSVDFCADFLSFWLVPLLNDARFVTNRTLLLLTFDETETYTQNNRVFTVLLGGEEVITKNLTGTKDSTYYTHYSSLSTVEANWGLGSLGRGDTNKTMSNVFQLVANVTGYNNTEVTGDAIPLTNLTTIIPGPLNAQMWFPFTAPNISAVGAGGGSVHVASGVNTNLTISNAPMPVNLTAVNATLPADGYFNASAASASASNSTSGSGSSSSATEVRVAAAGVISAFIGAMALLA